MNHAYPFDWWVRIPSLIVMIHQIVCSDCIVHFCSCFIFLFPILLTELHWWIVEWCNQSVVHLVSLRGLLIGILSLKCRVVFHRKVWHLAPVLESIAWPWIIALEIINNNWHVASSSSSSSCSFDIRPCSLWTNKSFNTGTIGILSCRTNHIQTAHKIRCYYAKCTTQFNILK